jgi:hypothetical protein
MTVSLSNRNARHGCFAQIDKTESDARLAHNVECRGSLFPKNSGRVPPRFMRRGFLVAALVLCYLPSYAMGPEYFSSRDWIKEKSSSKARDSSQVVYVGSLDAKKYFTIKWTTHLTVTFIVALVGFKDRDVSVTILRKQNPVKPIFPAPERGGERSFSFQPGDVVWVCSSDEPW